MADRLATHRSTAVALTVALVLFAAPLPAQASGEYGTPPNSRSLTLGGHPLAQLIVATARKPALPADVSLLGRQVDAFGTEQPTQTRQRFRGGGMSRGMKVLLGAGIGAAGGAVVGLSFAEVQCSGEGGRNCDSGRAQSLLTGVFGLIGAGIGAGVGALLP